MGAHFFTSYCVQFFRRLHPNRGNGSLRGHGRWHGRDDFEKFTGSILQFYKVMTDSRQNPGVTEIEKKTDHLKFILRFF